jgi:hypothetical protein
MRSQTKPSRWLHVTLTSLLVAAVFAGAYAPAAVADVPAPAPHGAAPRQAILAPGQTPGLDSRAQKLATMLQLSEPQQAELARILANEHEQIRQLWREQKVAPEYRVSAMRAISDKTEEQIRALLNDEQKKKYIASHPHNSSPSNQESTLDYWLHATQPK